MADQLSLFKPRGAVYAQPITFCPYKKLSKPLYLVYKNFQGINSYNNFVAILEYQCLHEFILSLSDLYTFMQKSNSFTWNKIHSKLSFGSLNSCVGCTSRYLESLGIQFEVMDQRLHWWLKKKIEWRLNFTGDWQNKTAKYFRPISAQKMKNLKDL